MTTEEYAEAMPRIIAELKALQAQAKKDKTAGLEQLFYCAWFHLERLADESVHAHALLHAHAENERLKSALQKISESGSYMGGDACASTAIAALGVTT